VRTRFGWRILWAILGVTPWVAGWPAARCETTISSVRVFTEPAGAQFTVDGQAYTSQAVFLWPAGSKHFLVAPRLQNTLILNTQYVLTGWETNLGVPVSVEPITADPGLTYVKVVFRLEYALLLRYFSCPPNSLDCAPHSPGSVAVNGILYSQDADLYFPAGSQVSVQAYPNSGYVFAGWSIPGVSAGNAFLASFVINQPLRVTPMFQNARPVAITIDTSPPGLEVLLDRTPATTPANVEWGWNSEHTLGTAGVQRDAQNRLWIFDSWSDGGTVNHTFRVTPGASPVTVTARFAPGATASFLTQPPGLPLQVDGRINWPSYNFSWAADSMHSVEAPAAQTDGRGHKYRFQSWSNGASAAQQVRMPNPPQDFRLTANYNPVAQVILESEPTGVALRVDGEDCATPCVVERPPGTTVSVSAPLTVPSSGGRLAFLNWSDGGPASRTLTAADDPQSFTARYRWQYPLTLSAVPPEAAGLLTVPASPDSYYDSPARVQVTVQPRAGYRFRSWTGDLSGTGASAWIEMGAPHSVQALLDAVPYVPDSAVQNAAGRGPLSAVAPGSVVSVFGLNLAEQLAVGPASPLAQSLADVTVNLGDRLVPLFFVSPNQINLQLPADVEPGPQTLRIQAAGKPAVQAAFTAARNAPGIFCRQSGGLDMAVAEHEDGSAIIPASPARRDELVTVYGTGLGPYDHPAPDGFALPVDVPFPLLDPVEIVLSDVTVTPELAAGAAGRVGVQVVRFRLTPEVPAGGNVRVVLRVNGVESNPAVLPVE